MNYEEYDNKKILEKLIGIRNHVNDLIYIYEQRVKKDEEDEIDIGEKVLRDIEKLREMERWHRTICPYPDMRYYKPYYYTLTSIPDIKYSFYKE